MKLFPTLVLAVFFTLTVHAQDRSAALEEFNGLKKKAASLESVILAPEKADIEAATKDGLNVFRILPRETYDNSFSSIRGGGAYYSFYFRYNDYGHGSDLALEQNYLSTGSSGLGLMADLGNVPLSEISAETSALIELVSYQNSKYPEIEKDRALVYKGLKLGETTFNTRLSPIVGHTYVLRSLVFGYYDVVVGFRILRKDEDGSLIIFWKLLEQLNTQTYREAIPKRSDAELLKSLTDMTHRDIFSNVRPEVRDSVAIMRGAIDRQNLPYLVQLATSAGALKVVNALDVK